MVLGYDQFPYCFPIPIGEWRRLVRIDGLEILFQLVHEPHEQQQFLSTGTLPGEGKAKDKVRLGETQRLTALDFGHGTTTDMHVAHAANGKVRRLQLLQKELLSSRSQEECLVLHFV